MRVMVESGHATWWMDIVLTREDVCRTGLLQLPERQHAVRLYAGRHNETQNPTEVPMSDLIVIVYPSEDKAEEVRQRLFKLQKEYLITINDAVIAVKTEGGTVKLNQLVNTTAVGAASGSFWGLLIGVLFLNPIIGVALGAASGALGGALSDFGINDNFMKELAASIKPGDAALFVLIKNMTADKVLNEIKDAGGTVLKTSLDETKEQVLRDALAKAAPPEAPPQPAKSA
jgi:Predicted membrane protein